jgi:hypothetical protein
MGGRRILTAFDAAEEEADFDRTLLFGLAIVLTVLESCFVFSKLWRGCFLGNLDTTSTGSTSQQRWIFCPDNGAMGLRVPTF